MTNNPSGEDRRLRPYFTRLGVWSFSIGTSIGWGSFVVTCNTYLSQAGILGTVLGLLVGMAVVLVINRNLCYMIRLCPDPGGIYTYGTRVRGHDTGFLIAWFLLLTYLAILWANITSLPLFARAFFGDFFRFGRCYTVFGYEVYIGEVLLSVAAISLVGLLCCRSRMLPQYLMIAMALIFVGSLTVCAVTALIFHGSAGSSFAPLYLPDKRQLNQIIRIAVISPWAFIGFENVAHFSGELAFPAKKIRGVMLWSVILTTAVYILMSLLSVSAFPPEYENWLAYIQDMGNLDGLKAFPAFYAASRYMGDAGVTILLLALLSVIFTSIIGNLTALSRLLFALGRDRVLPERVGTLNKRGIPAGAYLLAVVVSCCIPFLGRTAIGWIVDVTTLGATIIYGFLSDAVFKDAKTRGDKIETVTGMAGTVLMVFFAVLLLAPKLLSFEAMAAESYLLFAAWSILGLLAFRVMLSRDKKRVFGSSIIVWIMLLLLMLLTTMMWVNRETQVVTENSMDAVREYYGRVIDGAEVTREQATAFLTEQTGRIENANSLGTLTSFSLFIIAVVIMVNNYRTARKREQEWQDKLGIARQIGLTDALTSVKNKNAFTQLEERIDGEILSGECAPFAVVVCDINNLKLINDRQGHRAGDECIKRVSSLICKTYTHSPVYRYGGDEFVVFLRGDDYVNRQSLLDRIRRFSEECLRSGGDGRDVVAAGMADYQPQSHNSLLRVFEQADREMYENKQKLKSSSGSASV